ncbi:uncharacterized protein [Bemisia tabaci]|uniref:uncharacterized protein isoform X2 n=1 Tax=Bemisia tabaci TaxID=7038 RepID=UPI0008F98CE8|nr:PREDICTED: uncharacterized protein LOC109035964 isoform X2 [Bemisia tabaci]
MENATPWPSGMATNVEPELTSQSFFIPGNMNVTSLKSDMDNITALDTFQLDANGQIIPLYTDLEEENPLLLETGSESLDSSLLPLKNNSPNSLNSGDSLNLKNLLSNDIIITVPLPLSLNESKFPNLLNVQLKPPEKGQEDVVPAKSLPNEAPPPDYIEERLKVFQNSIVECKMPKTKPVKCKVKSGKGDALYACEFCGMEFEKSRQYYGHLHVHSGEQLWICQHCKASFQTQYQLRRHERTYHQDFRPHVCSICNETFERHSQLSYHRRRVHEKEKSFKCQICSKAFFKPSDLKTHLNIHLKVNGCICETCGRRFSHVSNLIRHRRVHSGIKPYICRACGRRFTQVTSLNDHKAYCRAVTKPIQCSHCSEQIAPHLFRKHMLDAHGILEKRTKTTAEKRLYFCKVCGERFPFINAVKKHQYDVHSNPQAPLACSECSKEFQSLDAFLVHCCAIKSKENTSKPSRRKDKEPTSKTETASENLSYGAHFLSEICKDPNVVIKTGTTSGSYQIDNYMNLDHVVKVSNTSGSVVNSSNSSNCDSTRKAAENRNDVQLNAGNNLDLNVEMLDANLKSMEMLKDIPTLSERKPEKETEDLIELSTTADFLPNEHSDMSERLMNSNYVTIDLDFSKDFTINSILNPDFTSLGKALPTTDKLPPLIPLYDRLEKDLFDSTEASENIIKLVGADSGLDYKALLNDARALILGTSDGDHKLSEALGQFNGENLSSSLLRSVLMPDNSMENDELSEINFAPSPSSHESQEENKILYLNNELIMEKTTLDPLKENSEGNLPSNQCVIFPGKITSKLEEVYLCTHCNRAFFNLEELNEHSKLLNLPAETIQRVKVPKEIHICRYCSKTFSKRKSLTQHIGLHSNDSCKYQCDVCNQKFAWKTSLSRHMASHVKDEQLKFPCETCDKSYVTMARLQEHIKRDHYNQRPHMCKICAKCFFKKSDLKAHMRTHTQEKPYMCGTCAKSFRHVSHLIRHERTHTGIKPYKCNHCSGSFSQSAVLKNHVKVKHPDVLAETTA